MKNMLRHRKRGRRERGLLKTGDKTVKGQVCWRDALSVKLLAEEGQEQLLLDQGNITQYPPK